jgi:hypothetical protein
VISCMAEEELMMDTPSTQLSLASRFAWTKDYLYPDVSAQSKVMKNLVQIISPSMPLN